MVKKKKILFVDDDGRIQDGWLSSVEAAGSPYQVFSALDLSIAQEILQDLLPDVLVIDSCVPGDTPNTMEFITTTKKKFPDMFILGVAPVEESRRLLSDAGCDAVCCKSEVFLTLQECFKK